MSELVLEKKGERVGTEPPKLPLEPARIEPGMGEREWSRGSLSRDVSYRLLITGELGAKEIGKLMKLLKAQKEVLSDEDGDQDDPNRRRLALVSEPSAASLQSAGHRQERTGVASMTEEEINRLWDEACRSTFTPAVTAFTRLVELATMKRCAEIVRDVDEQSEAGDALVMAAAAIEAAYPERPA